MIKTIDNKLHHLEQLAHLELQTFNVFELKKFTQELRKFLDRTIDMSKTTMQTAELEKLNEFVEKYFSNKVSAAQAKVMHAYIVGKIVGTSDIIGSVLTLPIIDRMPQAIAELSKRYYLTIEEAAAMKAAGDSAGVFMQNATTLTQAKVANIVQTGIKSGQGQQAINQTLMDKIADSNGELNRDWQRVAITEINSAFSNGYLALFAEGEYVLGVALPDACPHCKDLIHGKVYKVLKENIPPDYAGLTGKEYERIAAIYDNYVWENKNNFLRSGSPNKKLDKSLPASPDNIIPREHHEMFTPAIPMHPHCRCRWLKFFPNQMFVDNGGEMQLKNQDTEAHQAFQRNLIDRYNNLEADNALS